MTQSEACAIRGLRDPKVEILMKPWRHRTYPRAIGLDALHVGIGA